MERTLKNSYIEVGKILDILGDKYKDQIPDKIKKLFYTNEINNDIIIDTNDFYNVEDIRISRNALIIISILNYKYWEKDENKKQLLKQIYNNNEEEYQEKINMYKDNDWLKNRRINNKENSNVEVTELSLVVQNNNSLLERIKQFFKNIFRRKREY